MRLHRTWSINWQHRNKCAGTWISGIETPEQRSRKCHDESFPHCEFIIKGLIWPNWNRSVGVMNIYSYANDMIVNFLSSFQSHLRNSASMLWFWFLWCHLLPLKCRHGNASGGGPPGKLGLPMSKTYSKTPLGCASRTILTASSGFLHGRKKMLQNF